MTWVDSLEPLKFIHIADNNKILLVIKFLIYIAKGSGTRAFNMTFCALVMVSCNQYLAGI